MNMHDATEEAYKNGYKQGKIDAVEEIHNLTQSRDYWKTKAEKLAKKLKDVRKGMKEK